MHRFVRRQVLIVGIRNLYRAVFDTHSTARAVVLDNVSGLFVQADFEIPGLPCNGFNFCIGQNFDVWMPADLDQFGG